MRNKKGFTLIELLAVIAILGIVLGIAAFTVTNVLNRSKTDVAEVDKGMIRKAAELYVNENYAILKNELKSPDGLTIPINTLVEEGYLSDTTYTGSVTIKIDDNGKMDITVDADRINITDKSGANPPKLAEGMIPVVYDEESGNWKVADKSSEWYNYDKQMWANAVTTSSSTYRTAKAGTEIPMEDINSMWVWIPRYKYKISNNIGSSSAVTSPPEIDVVFENGTETTGESLTNCPIDATTCYYTHPAFRNGIINKKSTNYDQGGWDEELEGIWVGKFETSGSATTPTIKPDVIALTNQNVKTRFDTSLKFAGGTRNTSNGTVTFSGNSTYGLTSSTDTHMMKNTEWGAVAYLSQSKYGKMGNPNYSGANKEIYINNSSGTYTGRSGGGPSGNTPINGTYSNQTSTTQYNTYGFYTYDDYLLNYNTNTKGEKVVGKGTGASTTGNIYGIYDMSGGVFEHTMGNWAGIAGDSGFTTSNLPGGSNGSKYYEKYTGISSGTPNATKSIKGDATYETMNWYSDATSFSTNNHPWPARGGLFNNSSSGIFYSNGNTFASSFPSRGFRTVLIP